MLFVLMETMNDLEWQLMPLASSSSSIELHIHALIFHNVLEAHWSLDG